jgi:hypothetical protein
MSEIGRGCTLDASCVSTAAASGSSSKNFGDVRALEPGPDACSEYEAPASVNTSAPTRAPREHVG